MHALGCCNSMYPRPERADVGPLAASRADAAWCAEGWLHECQPASEPIDPPLKRLAPCASLVTSLMRRLGSPRLRQYSRRRRSSTLKKPQPVRSKNLHGRVGTEAGGARARIGRPAHAPVAKALLTYTAYIY